VLDGLVAGAIDRTAGLAGRPGAEHGGAVELARHVGAQVRVHHGVAVAVGRQQYQEVVGDVLGAVAVGIVDLGQVTLVAPDRAGFFVLHVDQRMESIVDTVEAARRTDAYAVAAAFGVGTATDIEHTAIHALLEDDV